MATFAENVRNRPIFTLFQLAWVANFAAMGFVDFTRSRWATPTPDLIHSYPIQYKGGMTYYFSPALGAYLDVGFWVMAGCVCLMVLIQSRAKKKSLKEQANAAD